MTFGAKLLMLRKARGLSQEELAARIDVSRQAISRWESDAVLPDVPNLVALSSLFGVTTDYLVQAQPIADAPLQTEAAASAPLLDGETPPDAERPKPHRISKIVGFVLTGLGALGHLVILVLSTMIESWVPAVKPDPYGTTTTWYTTEYGFSYSGFVEKYRLEAILAILWVALAVGVILLIYAYRDKLRRLSPFTDE